MEWHKYTEIVEYYDLEDWPYEAHIHGYGKDWKWRAVVWATNSTPGIARSAAEGEANDVESAKDNVRRFFADVKAGG